ncbi:MAG: GGDEF domain-containing protein [Candidatus Nealsonbacteria bacterium]|nr:GGDEF domain-containing protein [Candidatus Nealsonbacteria bacterium]
MVILIGVVNLCLGYAAAVYLGVAPPGLVEAWHVLSARTGRVEEEEEEEEEELSDEAAEEMLAELASSPLDNMLDDAIDENEFDDRLEVEEYEDLDDEDSADLLEVGEAETWNLDEKYVETSILKLNLAMMKSGIRATDLDTRLRACRGHSDLETIEACLNELKEDCETYLAEQNEAGERFAERISEMGELSSLGDEIDMTNLEQASQIETTLSNITHMDLQSDLEAANGRLLEEIKNLRAARHKLRDSRDVAFLAVARYEKRLDKIEKRLYHDPLTKIRNRIGLETTLWSWWQQGRNKSRQMNAVLFDIDGFDDFNEDHGLATGDRVLQEVARLIERNAGKGNLVGRFAGQRFLVVMMDVGPRAAIKDAEMIRQKIAKIKFVGEPQNFWVTVGVGHTEISPEDTEQSLFGRLEEALKAAKQIGANSAATHDRTEATPIESPDFNAAETVIHLVEEEE